MLPFLAPKKIVSVIVSKHGKHPDVEVNPEVEAAGHEIDQGMKSAAEDILRAIDTRSPVDLAKALHAAFEIMEEAPHEEGPHINEEPGEE